MHNTLEQFREVNCSAMSETAELDFKCAFDPSTDPACWCEIIKDIVAMANTAGGMIVFGVDDDGQDSPSFVDRITEIDPAIIVDKIFRYTGCQFANFEPVKVRRPSDEIRPGLVIGPAPYPMVFTLPGDYRFLRVCNRTTRQ